MRKYLWSDGPAVLPRRSSSVRPRKGVVDEFAPLIDSMLRAGILIKAVVIQQRLCQEYGFTGNHQRVKLYVQKARLRISEELGIMLRELVGMRRFEVIPMAPGSNGLV